MTLEDLEQRAKQPFPRNRCGVAKVLPNLTVPRREKVSAFEAVLYNPVMCLILRGGKEPHIGVQSVPLRRDDALLACHAPPAPRPGAMIDPDPKQTEGMR